MGVKMNLIGQTFNRLTVVSEAEKTKDNHTQWNCQCSCGNPKLVIARGTDLKAGRVKSCGCYRKENISKIMQGNSYGSLRALDLTNQRYGHLLVLYKADTKAGSCCDWVCKCDCGNLYTTSSHHLRTGQAIRCTECSQKAIMSKGEDKINTILKENHIVFEYQKTFDTCRSPITNKQLKFDFYLSQLNCLIEFDGEQHFKISETSAWKEKQKTLKERDEYKNQWCKNNNIILIRIPYTQLNKITLEDLLPSTSQFII